MLLLDYFVTISVFNRSSVYIFCFYTFSPSSSSTASSSKRHLLSSNCSSFHVTVVFILNTFAVNFCWCVNKLVYIFYHLPTQMAGNCRIFSSKTPKFSNPGGRSGAPPRPTPPACCTHQLGAPRPSLRFQCLHEFTTGSLNFTIKVTPLWVMVVFYFLPFKLNFQLFIRLSTAPNSWWLMDVC